MNVAVMCLDEIRSDRLFGTALEIVLKHKKELDRVVVVGLPPVEFGSFFYGYSQLKTTKYSYQQRLQAGVKLAGINKNHLVTLTHKDYDIDIPDYKNVRELRHFKIDNFDLGSGISSDLISFFRDHDLAIDQYKKKIKNTLNVAYGFYKNLLKWLELSKIDLVYMFNGRFLFNKAVLRACEFLETSFYIYESGYLPETYSLYKDTVCQDSGYAQKQMNADWKNYGVGKEKVAQKWFATRKKGMHGRFFFTSRQNESFLPKNFDIEKKNIVIFNSALDEYEAMEDWKNHVYDDETKGIEKIITHFLDQDNTIQFYLRVHPNLWGTHNTQMRLLSEIESKKYKNLKIIWPEELIDSYELINSSDITISFGSTIGMEATFWGASSVMIGRSLYDRLDCSYNPDSHEEVIDLLLKDLQPKPIEGCLKYAFWHVSSSIGFEYYNAQKGTLLGNRLHSVSRYDRLKLKAVRLWERLNFK